MTSRERIIAAFEHRDPDRTPIWEKLIKSPVADEILGRPCAASSFHTRMERMADGAWDGLDVTLGVWEGMFHVFQSHQPLLPEAREAIAHIARLMRSG